MNEKKRLIIEAAIKAFAQKGYHATSIQEITDSLGIAKGSVYFYFKSKEDLLHSVFKYYFDLMMQRFRAVSEDMSLTPRGRLSKQVVLSYEQYVENRDFIMMLMKERFDINEEIGKLLYSVRAQTLYWYQNCILEIYGEGVRNYSLDAATLFNAMTVEYMNYMIFDRKEFDFRRLALFFVERLDEMVNGMMLKKQNPILDLYQMEDFLISGKADLKRSNSEVFDSILNMRNEIERLNLAKNQQEEILSSLLVLETEFEKDQPRKVVLKGMLAYLRDLKIRELRKYLSRLEGHC